MKNKKAQMGSAILWFYKILMLIIIIGGIVFIVSAHYSKQYDIREVESSVLAEKILNCFAPQSIFDKEKFSRETLDSCLIFDEREIFLNITLIEAGKQESLFLGEEDFKFYCESKEEGIEGKNFPSCLEQEYDIRIDGKQSKLNLFIAILKIEKNT